MACRGSFLLPSNASVDWKVLSFVGEKLRGHKRSLRVKYIKENTTREELYALLMAESSNGKELTRSKGVGDPMWVGFVNLCFSEQFKVIVDIGVLFMCIFLNYFIIFCMN